MEQVIPMNNSIARTTDKPVRRSLCCACGTLRTVSDNYAPRGDYTSPLGWTPDEIERCRLENRLDPSDELRPWVRRIERLKCSTCGQQTDHAMVFDLPRDPSEEQNAKESAAWRIVDEFVEDFQALGMDVCWRDDMEQSHAAGIRQYLDDNSWSLEVNERMPADRILRALTRLWDIALGFESSTKWFVHPGGENGWRPDRYLGVTIR